jgi:hypothetical protein
MILGARGGWPALPKNPITKTRKNETTKKTARKEGKSPKKLGRIRGGFLLRFRVFVLSCFRDWFLCKAMLASRLTLVARATVTTAAVSGEQEQPPF